MLPREMNRLFVAVNGSKETKIDVAQLRSELAGVAEFHRALSEAGILTGAHGELFTEHVGRHVDWVHVERSASITAPAEGPPNVSLRITAPSTGVPSVGLGAKAKSVECPHCHTVFMLDP